MRTMDWKGKITQILSTPPLFDEPMRFHTSLRIGGPADMLVFPSSREELKGVLAIAHSAGVPIFLVGQGTNLLVKDEGIKGLVVNLARFNPEIRFLSNHIVKVGPGVPVVKLAREAMNRGLGGLEFAIGIPGSLGGALYMNAGAYGFSIGDLVREVATMDFLGNERIRAKDELHFFYRKSTFQDEESIIVEVRLALHAASPEELQMKAAQIQKIRRSKQPQKPSAGSVFRNPPGNPAGLLIEKAGVKGHVIGGAQVSTLHGNFIVNTGGATAEDVLNLVEWVRSRVRETQGMELELEIKVVGRNGIERGR